MTEDEWLARDPDEMYFRAVDQLKSGERRKDLFCLACARLLWDLLEDDARGPFEWLEEHSGERKEPPSGGHVRQLFDGPARSLYEAHHRRQGGTAGAAAHVAYDFWAGWYEYAFPNLCGDYAVFGEVLREKPQTLLVSILRDIFGNPFRPVTFASEWRTDTATAIARQMYDSRDFSAMPILADAIQDAGCDNTDILAHCRDANQSHVRGCWVVDSVLGME